MTLFLLDNSVLQRYARSTAVGDAVRDLASTDGVLCLSDVLRLEAGYSARSAKEHAEIVGLFIPSFQLLPLTQEIGSLAVALQAALFSVGRGRAAGVVDLLHAATAIASGAVVVHYDADFEILGEVNDRLRHRWIVPRGSID